MFNLPEIQIMEIQIYNEINLHIIPTRLTQSTPIKTISKMAEVVYHMYFRSTLGDQNRDWVP